MKKISLLFFSLFLFSACNFWAEEEAPEDPIIKYTELTESHRTSVADRILEFFPDVASFPMAETNMSIEGKVILPNMTDKEGNITFLINSKSMSDMTEPVSPKISSKAAVSVNLEGDISGDARGDFEFLVIDEKFFAKIDEVNVDITDFPASEVLASITPELNNWYGDDFLTLNAQTNGNIDLQALFAKNVNGTQQIREEIRAIIEEADFFTMNEMLEPENGYARYEVELNFKTLEEVILGLARLGNLQAKEYADLKVNLKNSLSPLKCSGVLSIFEADPQYFQFTGTASNETSPEETFQFEFSALPEKSIFQINADNPDGTYSYNVLEVFATDEGYDFEVYGGKTREEKNTALRGKKTDNIFEATLINANDESEISITLQKTGEKWAGQITDTKTENRVVVIENLSFGENLFTIDVKIKEGENILGNFSLEYDVKEAPFVEVKIPEDYKPFSNLFDVFLPLATMGIPGVDPSVQEKPMDAVGEETPASDTGDEEEVKPAIKDNE